MSKIYDALKRLEAERMTSAPGRSWLRSVLPRSWWRGVALGFFGGLVAAALAMPLLLRSQRTAAPLEASTPAPQPVQAPLPVTPLGELPETPSRAPVRPSQPERAAEQAAIAKSDDAPAATESAAGERPAEPLPQIAVTVETDPRAQAAPTPPPPLTARTSPACGHGRVWVQVGSFSIRDNAARLAARLESEQYPTTVTPGRSSGAWVVRVGAYPDRSAAEATRAALQRQGFPGFLVGDPGSC